MTKLKILLAIWEAGQITESQLRKAIKHENKESVKKALTFLLLIMAIDRIEEAPAQTNKRRRIHYSLTRLGADILLNSGAVDQSKVMPREAQQKMDKMVEDSMNCLFSRRKLPGFDFNIASLIYEAEAILQTAKTEKLIHDDMDIISNLWRLPNFTCHFFQDIRIMLDESEKMVQSRKYITQREIVERVFYLMLYEWDKLSVYEEYKDWLGLCFGYLMPECTQESFIRAYERRSS